MTGDQFATLIGTVIAVGAVLVAVIKLIIGREISAKLNGLPQRIADLERRQDHDDSWRHNTFAPLFADAQLNIYTLKGDAKNVERLILRIDDRLDRIEKKFDEPRS